MQPNTQGVPRTAVGTTTHASQQRAWAIAFVPPQQPEPATPMPAMQAKPVTPATLPIYAAILLVAALFYGARQPIAVGLFAEPFDKLAHTALFATLAYLLAATRPRSYNRVGWLASCALAAATVGLADETHQMFIPGRSAGLDDVAADAIGALLGVTLWFSMVHAAHRVTEKLNNC